MSSELDLILEGVDPREIMQEAPAVIGKSAHRGSKSSKFAKTAKIMDRKWARKSKTAKEKINAFVDMEKAGAIKVAKLLLRKKNGDVKKAMASWQFYVNRLGRKLLKPEFRTKKRILLKVKDIIQKSK